LSMLSATSYNATVHAFLVTSGGVNASHESQCCGDPAREVD